MKRVATVYRPVYWLEGLRILLVLRVESGTHRETLVVEGSHRMKALLLDRDDLGSVLERHFFIRKLITDGSTAPAVRQLVAW